MKYNKDFSLLMAGQFVSQVGDKFHMLAIAFWVLKTTGSSAKMGMVLAASIIPSLVLGFISGTFVDRYNRKTIIVGTDFFRSIIIACFAVLFYFGVLNFYLILAMQILLSINAAFFDPCIPSVIPQMVKKEDLTSANSKHQFISGFSTIAGAFLGGIIVASFGYLVVFLINAVSFFLSACFEMFINIPESLQEHEKDALKKDSSVLSDMISGYRYIIYSNELVILLFMVMLIHFFVGSIEVIMPVAASVIGGKGPVNLGFFQSFFGLGTICMAIFLSFKDISGNEKKVLFSSIFAIGIIFVASYLIDLSALFNFYFYLALFFFIGCLIISASVSFKSLLQKSIDNNFAGRVFAIAGSIGNASIPAAMIVYGALLEKFAFTDLLVVSGLMLVPLSIISYILYKEKGNDRQFSKEAA